ncbi:MmcQ/YjbR family DNA-binding protein [Candidatus Clostridium stratigraminis]|uniref:MmcQ/YjbR family DNA-binding protein n=1 Tax=Candidatus Clostridium stratigraminis TaxID=3381661 RepID=A0ABW8TB73_9CLOT
MDFEWFKNYCLSKKGAAETYPFDDKTTVFKVGSKMFALTNKNSNPLSISLKCEPYLSQDLRREYSSITPGYHLNKFHWNTIQLDDSIEEEKVRLLIDLSYDLVFKGLKNSDKLNISLK